MIYVTALSSSTPATLNPTSLGAVPCVVWPKVAVEIKRTNSVALVVSLPRDHDIAADVYMGGRASRTLESRTVRRVAQHTATALAFLHEQGYCHGSIRPEVIMVDSTGLSSRLVCLPELSWIATSGTTDVDAPFDDLYTAPELRHCDQEAASVKTCSLRRATAASDAWSFGATLYTLLYGRAPFASDATDFNLQFAPEDRKHKRWQGLLKSMMAIHPGDRLLPADIAGGALNRLM